MAATIHIVDDDHQVRASTSFLLRSLGYHAEIYSSGTEFLDQARLENGCILLDLRMPGQNGLEVQEELRQRAVPLPVVVLSGHGDIATAVQAMKLGALDFLEKPYEEAALINAINRALAVQAEAEERANVRLTAAARLEALSERELQVLRGLLAGLTNKGMGRRLDLSPRTVEMHRASLMDNLGVNSLSEAVRIAIDGNLSPLELGYEEARMGG